MFSIYIDVLAQERYRGADYPEPVAPINGDFQSHADDEERELEEFVRSGRGGNPRSRCSQNGQKWKAQTKIQRIRSADRDIYSRIAGHVDSLLFGNAND